MVTSRRQRWSRICLAWLAALTLASAAPGHGLAAPPSAPQAGSFIVTSALDSNSADTVLTLREALLVARGGTAAHGLGGPATAGEQMLLGGCTFDGGGHIIGGCGEGLADTITFSTALGVNPVITLAIALPAITDTAATALHGHVNGVFPIIDASLLGGATDALLIASHNNTVRGLTIRAASRDNLRVTGNGNTLGPNLVLHSAGQAGLRVDGGDQNQISVAVVGVLTAGSVDCGGGHGNQGGGIILQSSAISNAIASSTLNCNEGYGLLLTGAGTAGNTLRASAVRAQAGTGIVVDGGAHHNVIGQPGMGNLISGNDLAGVLITAGSHSNDVFGNLIGLNAAGTAASANGQAGVHLANGAHDNRIGDRFAGNTRNVISGNSGAGVQIDTGAHTNWIAANYIGLSQSGMARVGNGGAGVLILNSNTNYLGAGGGSTQQFISGNQMGIYLAYANENVIAFENYIGLAGDAETPLGNDQYGIYVLDGANNYVRPMWVAYNGAAGGRPGVAVVGGSALNNLVLPYATWSNGGLPIDLGDNGPTLNDPGDGDSGPNSLLNYPVATSATATTVSGTACANCFVYAYRAIGDPSQAGGGGGNAGVTQANGAGAWTLTLPEGLTAADLSYAACTAPCFASGNTSEFSPRPQVLLPLIQK